MYMTSMDIYRVIFLTAKVITVLWSAGKKNRAARGYIAYRLKEQKLSRLEKKYSTNRGLQAWCLTLSLCQ